MLYIVVTTPNYNNILSVNSSLTYANPTVAYFHTKEQLTNYLKSASGNIRVFEATEMDFDVEVKLKDKDPEALFTR